MFVFVHDNGNLNILSMTKCGHTAMAYYFGMPAPHNHDRTLSHWLEYKSPKVVVLRHPVERMHSAINFYEKQFNELIVEYEKTGQCDNFSLIEDLINWDDRQREWEIEQYIFNKHCRPYMHILKNRDFRIIKFEELSQYIPKIPPGGIETNTTNRNIDPFPKNRYFKREDMLREIELYENLVANREVITPEEWRELT
jgi:hypothetical protein